MNILNFFSETFSAIGTFIGSMISGLIYFILNNLGLFIIAGGVTAFAANIHDVEIDRFLAAARGLGYTFL